MSHSAVALAALLLAAAPARAQRARDPAIALIGVTVIDPATPASGQARRTDQTILIRNGVIQAIGPSSAVVIPRGTRRVNATGKFVIPGLWDAADVRRMHELGVLLLAGTDAGSVLVYPGFALHEELRLLVEEAGLTPLEALWSATIGPARFAGIDAQLGSIAEGKIADLVLLDDLLRTVRNGMRPRAPRGP